MLDEGPRQEPILPNPPPPPASPSATPAATSPESPAAPKEPTGAALLAADVSAALADMESSARRLLGASAAAFVVTLIGLPLSVWDSAPFALLVMTASIVTAVTAWLGDSKSFRSSPIPRVTIELVAALLVAVLALLKVVEVVFDFDTDGVVGLVIAGVLLAAAGGLLVAVQRRGADPLGALLKGDRGARIAAAGLLLVLVGWILNLSISIWTMGQAALPVAVLTLAALTVAEAPRLPSPPIVAWVGAGIGAFGAVLALANWNDLTTLGRTELELSFGDFLGLLIYSIGAALIIAGGVLSGIDAFRETGPQPRPPDDAPSAIVGP